MHKFDRIQLMAGERTDELQVKCDRSHLFSVGEQRDFFDCFAFVHSIFKWNLAQADEVIFADVLVHSNNLEAQSVIDFHAESFCKSI